MFGDKITQISVVSIPMRVAFRGLRHREALIFRGTERWAEFSPFIEYRDEEAARWLASAISFANEPLPKLNRTKIGINATLPAVPISELKKTLERFGEFQTLKLKIAEAGQSLAADLERIHYLAELYPNVRLRLDANGALSVAMAKQLVMQLTEFNIDYLEQPVSSIAEMVELRRFIAEMNLNILIAADELIRKAEDPLLVSQQKAADVVMLKVQPLGGIASALRISEQAGLPTVVSSALETSIGISQGLYLSASLEELNYDCGLGTLNLLEGDVCERPLIPENGFLEVREVEPSPRLLNEFAADSERTGWWLERLERCYRLLEA